MHIILPYGLHIHILIMIVLLFTFYTKSCLQIIMPQKKKTLLNQAGDQSMFNAALHYHIHDDRIKMSSFDTPMYRQ